MKRDHFDQQEKRSQPAKRLENKSAESILQWALDTFGDEVVLACSFGAEDVVLVDMISKICPHPNVFFLDTEKHFEETYATRDRLQEKYHIHFIEVKPEMTLAEQAAAHGDQLWMRNPDLCCQIRKMKPLADVLTRYQAWITGIRREQSPTRATAETVEWDQKFQLVKINPLITWTHADIWQYIRAHNVPYHPLHDHHYPSIGCSVCTRPVTPGEDFRAGRWSGHHKTECGLH